MRLRIKLPPVVVEKAVLPSERALTEEALRYPQVALESVPSIKSGERRELLSANYDQKLKYHNNILSAIKSGNFHSILEELANSLHMKVVSHHVLPGSYWENVNENSAPLPRGAMRSLDRSQALLHNPVSQVLLSVGYRNHDLSVGDRRKVEAFSGYLGSLLDQEAVGYIKPIKANSPHEASGIYFHTGKDVSIDELKQLSSQAVSPKFKNGEVNAHHTDPSAFVTAKGGIHVLHFGDDHAGFVKSMASLFDSVYPDRMIHYEPYVNAGGLVETDNYMSDRSGKDAYETDAARNGEPSIFTGFDAHKAAYRAIPTGINLKKAFDDGEYGGGEPQPTDTTSGVPARRGEAISGGVPEVGANEGGSQPTADPTADPLAFATILAGGHGDMIDLQPEQVYAMLLEFVKQAAESNDQNSGGEQARSY